MSVYKRKKVREWGGGGNTKATVWYISFEKGLGEG
jgi:hypothetical protein